MKNCGLKGEFNVKISQNPRLEVIAENAWQADWKSLRYSKYLEHLCRDHSSSGQSNSRWSSPYRCCAWLRSHTARDPVIPALQRGPTLLLSKILHVQILQETCRSFLVACTSVAHAAATAWSLQNFVSHPLSVTMLQYFGFGRRSRVDRHKAVVLLSTVWGDGAFGLLYTILGQIY